MAFSSLIWLLPLLRDFSFSFPYLLTEISPDQSLEILADYAQQCMLGRKLLVHAVTYDCGSPAAIVSNCQYSLP